MSNLSLDFMGLWSQATEFINSMWLLVVIPLGVILGASLITFIAKQLKLTVNVRGFFNGNWR